MIEKEAKEWGIRLTAKPFSSIDLFGNISIDADITAVDEKSPTVVIHVNGISRMVEFGIKELITFNYAITELTDEIRRGQAELKTAKNSPAKKKTSKKK